MDKKIPKEKTGFNKLPEAVQEKISPKLAKEFNMGGMVDKRSPFMGGGIAYAGGGRAMKREMYSEGTKPINKVKPTLGLKKTQEYKKKQLFKKFRKK